MIMERKHIAQEFQKDIKKIAVDVIVSDDYQQGYVELLDLSGRVIDALNMFTDRPKKEAVLGVIYGDPRSMPELLDECIEELDNKLKDHSDFAVAYSELKRITKDFLDAQAGYFKNIDRNNAQEAE